MKTVLCIFIFIFPFTICAQEVPVSLQQQLEDLTDANENELPDENLLLQLEHLVKRPLNINIASPSELEAIFFLTPIQIEQLINYRQLLGNFIDLHELQAVPSWDLNLIQKALPYITTNPG